ncbi:MAG: radical SAM family heme chaperone HemW [Candidatus Limivivens sp.]|nr:radical SAM family heme chaperone HemW [Candidatus Limivivens sp.]
MEETKLELYVHIPFCVRKCAYCDFLSFAAKPAEKEQYVQVLIREIQSWKGKESRNVSSVFFGGGTPSILLPGQIEEILEEIGKCFFLEKGAEITLECNPGTLTEEKLSVYRRAGVNRLSIGLQSADNRELKLLGRIHTWEDFQESFRLARQAGFSNLNIDLISALPGQTPQSWRSTLEKVLMLEPEHISAYSLIVEEGTPFYQAYGEDARRRDEGKKTRWLPSEEEERQMYEDTEVLLSQAGYQRYEISNYARSGFACRHNIGYWEREDYLGFGLGASSLYHNIRFKNTDSMEAYLEGEFEKTQIQELTVEEQMEEAMFLGLRMMQGVSLEKFQRTFGQSCESVYGEVLRKLEKQGLLKRQDGRAALTEKGIDVSNYCMAEFLLS